MKANRDPRSTVAAVVVTYHPDPSVIGLLSAIRAQVDQVVVVDNASTYDETEPLRTWARSAGATWIANNANLGIATALNQAARIARSAGHGWLLTLDQDTTVPADLVMQLRAAIAADEQPDQIAIAAPQTEHQRDSGCGDATSVRRRMVITSGSLVSLAAWHEVGGYRGEFFIDMVDADFALRLGQHGYRVILACRASVDHSIGQPRTHVFLGRRVETSNHPAWRRYFISRNRVIAWREHWREAPAWVAFDAYGQLRDTVVMAFTERDRRRKLRATLRGLADGLRGRAPRVTPPGARR